MLGRFAVIGLIGMVVGSTAFATSEPPTEAENNRHERRRVEFACVFEGLRKVGPVCRAFGHFELHRDRDHHNPSAERDRDGRWRNRNGDMRIVCAEPKGGEIEAYFGPVRSRGFGNDHDDHDGRELSGNDSGLRLLDDDSSHVEDRDRDDRDRFDFIELIGRGITQPRIEVRDFGRFRSGLRRALLGIDAPKVGRLHLAGACEFRHRRHFDNLK